MDYAIETLSLTKVFSDWWGRDKVYAVDDLNLRVRYNEVFGLLGPNGSGKTTTLKMLLGLLYPTKGRAVVLGGEGSNPKINTKIGFLPEESYLYRYLNARETLDFYGRLFGLPSKVRKMRIEALLDMVGLKAVANRAVGTFSKGMARRIGLAQALINDPDLLILDEPTTGLDPIGTRQIKDLVLKLAERGKTVLLCSHLLADVEDVCDRIAILYGGKIQAEGKVKDLLQQTNRKQINTGAISDTAIERIKQLIQDERAECEVTSPMDKLEIFFIKTVAEAQQQAQPTSGAVSTTEIGGFLIQETPKDVLDKLVSAPVSQETPSEPPATEPVVPAESPESKRDERLLTELASPVDPAQPEPVAQTEKVETQPVEPKASEQDQVEKSILDQLTDRSNHRDQDEEPAEGDKPQIGDPSDA
ncbi:MAG: ATP-binding cassette domain-containing protein [Planctomycetes bacterium]|nr:ATP-binding cassette domain-containing protein [Planctomycetota bacterium]